MTESIQKIAAINPATSTQALGSVAPQAQPKTAPPADGLTFSKHLSERMNRRRIDLSPEKLDRLSQAVDKVAEKGARESVVSAR